MRCVSTRTVTGTSEGRRVAELYLAQAKIGEKSPGRRKNFFTAKGAVVPERRNKSGTKQLADCRTHNVQESSATDGT